MVVEGRGNWTTEELMRLRELFPRSPAVRISRLLGRTEESVLRQARRLFDRGQCVGPWNDADVQALRVGYGVLDENALCLILARSPEDVRERLRVLRTERRVGGWEDDEIRLLKRVYSSRSDGDLEVSLSRTVEDIQAKARELCLAKDKGRVQSVRMPRWQAAEVVRLRALYPTYDNLEIARILGRSVTSIANKAHQLGLSKAPQTLRRMGQRNIARRHLS